MPSSFNHEAARGAIEDRGLTVSEVATALEMSRPSLSLILHGRRKGSIDLAKRIAEYLGVSPYRFIGPDDPKAAVIELAKLMGVTADDLKAAS